MGTTSNYSWPYPAATDPVADGAQNIEDLATDADTTVRSVELATVMRFADAASRTSALSGIEVEGMVTFLQDTDALQYYDGSSWAAVGQAGGKILQIVRATDTTQRSTTSTSFTDITGLSVTITPTSATSTILVILSVCQIWGTNAGAATQITDSSNVALSGAEAMEVQDSTSSNAVTPVLVIGYDAPATTSAVTYKGRFRSKTGASTSILNATNTGQIFALEVGT